MSSKNVNYIEDLLSKNESTTLEFKRFATKEVVAEILCSFLNRDGGHLVIGVEEGRHIVGFKDAVEISKRIQSYVVASIIPEPAVSVDIQKVDKNDVVIFTVWKGINQPYIYNGSVYIRVGSETRKSNSQELADIIQKSSSSNKRWETKSAIEVELEDIDLSEVKDCISDVNKTGRENNFPNDPLQFLSKYNMYKNGDFTNAAVILFGKNPAMFFPQVRVRLSVFQTDKTGRVILYDKLFDGNLFKSIRQITEFFDLAFGVSSSLKESDWKRADKSKFPRSAIREALLNAFVHRDYSSFSSSIAINIYPNKLEINSYGSLPEGISVSSLSEDHLSIPVNPAIAHIFFLRNWIEKIGIGTVKMIANCKELGFKAPKWNVIDNTVSVIFPDVVIPFKFNEGISEGISEGITLLLNEPKNEGINEGLSEGLKESLIEILQIIDKERSIRASSIADELDKPYKTIERHIKLLKEIDAIDYIGSKRTGGYQLSNSLRKMIKE